MLFRSKNPSGFDPFPRIAFVPGTLVFLFELFAKLVGAFFEFGEFLGVPWVTGEVVFLVGIGFEIEEFFVDRIDGNITCVFPSLGPYTFGFGNAGMFKAVLVQEIFAPRDRFSLQ